MSSMFNGCESLISLELSTFNTGNVADMGSMFDGCNSHTSPDFHTYESNTESNSVLSGYFKIDSTSINKFVTDDKTMITDMFKRCIILKSF